MSNARTEVEGERVELVELLGLNWNWTKMALRDLVCGMHGLVLSHLSVRKPAQNVRLKYVYAWMDGHMHVSMPPCAACRALMPSALHASFSFNEAKACSPALHGHPAEFAGSVLFPMPVEI